MPINNYQLKKNSKNPFEFFLYLCAYTNIIIKNNKNGKNKSVICKSRNLSFCKRK